MGDLTRDFSIAEVRCKCDVCAKLENPSLPPMGALIKLQGLRDDYGKPVSLSCAVRCKAHNAAVGGAPDSRHLPEFGDAFDLVCSDSNDRYRLVGAAIRTGFRFIEVCPDHIHVDLRPSFSKLIVGSDHG